MASSAASASSRRRSGPPDGVTARSPGEPRRAAPPSGRSAADPFEFFHEGSAATPRVERYTGVDSSPQMIARARQVVDRFPDVEAEVLLQSIEETRGRYDSIVSLQSYYSWSDGAAILRHVRGLVGAGGTFVLASANETLDIEKLLDIASRELLMHPDWDDFARLNRALAGTGTGNFVSLDTLVREVRAARFGVREAHTELYAGGLNFLVLAT